MENFKNVLSRPLSIITLVAISLLVLALALVSALAWRSHQALDPVHTHIEHLNRLQHIAIHLQRTLIAEVSGRSPLDPEDIAALRDRINAMAGVDAHLSAATPGQLHQIDRLLGNATEHPRTALISSLNLMREVMDAETTAHAALLDRVYHNLGIQFDLSVAVLIAFPLLAMLTLSRLRGRLLRPLDTLGELLSNLGAQDYRPVSLAGVTPLLNPLFESYNRLVSRLAELEQEHQERESALTEAVQSVTGTLLEYQQSLARAERLAAVGEVAAGLAHDLRNPLAGIRVACTNLEADLHDPALVERVQLVAGEIDRLIDILNNHLEQARHRPEPASVINLGPFTEELVKFLRYQLPSGITLELQLDDELTCRLPKASLRQVLLNLIINAREAIGEATGEIRLSVTGECNDLLLTVEDDGPGFPAEMLAAGPRTFTTNKVGGTGLGLAMVRRFVRDLGGELGLSSRAPRGARVTLRVPCSYG